MLYRATYPGARISGSARLDGPGSFQLARGVSIGERTTITVGEGATLELGEAAYVGKDVEISPASAIAIGAHVSIQDRCILLGQVSLGAHCILAPNVYISSGRHWHDLQPEQLIRDQDRMVADGEWPQPVDRHLPVVVGEDCWLGINVVIMRGVQLGRGVVVGANSVVTRDVEPYAVVAGAPARLIGRRLPFLPPKRISSGVPEDLPYFYSGFRSGRSGEEAGSHEDVLLATGRFSLALAGPGTRLALVARLTSGGAGSITLGSQRQLVDERWRELVFEISASDGWRFDFAVEGQGSTPEVSIRAASRDGADLSAGAASPVSLP